MNNLYGITTRLFSGSLWTPRSENTQKDEQKETSPLVNFAKLFPEVFANVVSNCQPKDMGNLKITCKDIKNTIEGDKFRNTIDAIFFPKIIEDARLTNLCINDLSDDSECLLEIISKNNPELALKIISRLYLDNKSYVRDLFGNNRNSETSKFSIEISYVKIPFVGILKTLSKLLKTTEAKRTFISTLENMFFVYNDSVTIELIDLLSDDVGYFWHFKNSNEVEYWNKWSITAQIFFLIQLGEKTKKSGSNEAAKEVYLKAAEIIHSVDIFSLTQAQFPNPLQYLAAVAMIAKRIEEFDVDKANAIFTKINEVYQIVADHIPFTDVCASYCEVGNVLPEMKEALLQRAKTLFIQAEDSHKIAYLKDSIMPITLLKELYPLIPRDPLLLKDMDDLPTVLKIARVAFSLEDYSFVKKLVMLATSQKSKRITPEVIKQLIKLNKIDEAINLSKKYKRVDLIMVIVSSIWDSNRNKAIALIDQSLNFLRKDKKIEIKPSFFDKFFEKGLTIKETDILTHYYHVIATVESFDPQRARSIAIEALNVRERILLEKTESNKIPFDVLRIPYHILNCLFQDPMQAHFIFNKYGNFSKNAKTFYALTTLDQCKNSNVKTKLFSELSHR